MELANVYVSLQKARTWKEEKVNYLPGAYAVALKHIYGDSYIHVDTKANKELLAQHRKGDVVVYKTELV